MTRWDEETDVLVAGSGGGLTGAYTAAREGLSVVVAEASDEFGGSTAYSGGGGMWFPCNPVLRRAGFQDSLDDAMEYFHAVVGDRTPVELQRAYVYGGARLIEYFEADQHFSFTPLPWPDYYGLAPHARLDGGRHTVPEPLNAAALGALGDNVRGPLDYERLGYDRPDTLSGGRALIGRLLSAVTAYPSASLRLGCAVEDLVVESGVVTGAVVNDRGTRRTVRTRRGVLLATGGFEHNAALRERHGVPGRATDSMGAPANMGLALEAGIRAGAAVDLMDQAWWSPGLTHPDGRSAFALWFTGGIFVNRDGRRFVNESAPYDRIGRVIIDELAGGSLELPYWMIYDDREGPVPPVKATNVSMVDTEKYIEAGLWHTAPSLPQLAEKIGVDPDNLVATVQRFNTFADSGVDDDFHRGDEGYDRAFSGGLSPMVPIEDGPFHAAAFGLSDLGTKGGLVTNSHGQVIDTSGAPIRGLYAAGNTMAAVSGTAYPGGGIPIGASMLFSHLAALHMAVLSS